MPALEVNHQLFYWDLQETFRFSCKSQFFFVLLHSSCCGWLAMSRWLGKKSMAWHYFKIEDVCLTFLLTFRNLGNFISVQMETAVGVYPLCIYTWHRCAPSTEGVHPMLSYIYLFGVGICCFLFLTLWSIPRYLKGKDEAKGNKIPTPTFYNSNPVSNNLLY